MNVSDIYTAVDKSKKTKRNQASPQPPPLSLDPVTDLYSVVDKKRKPKMKIIMVPCPLKIYTATILQHWYC